MAWGIGRRFGAFLAAMVLGLAGAAQFAAAAELAELPVLTSKHKVLDILMVARAAPITTFGDFKPDGWVFDVCARPADNSDSCPDTGSNLYGGARLQVQPGDTLKVHLVNKLPKVTDSEWATIPQHGYLALNPVNLHTHGLLVSPRAPTVDDPTYGDNIFVLALNPDNGPFPAGSMAHADVRVGFTDYKIHIPASHPPGLYWFHPHIHGISVNQISAGMSGVITIGKVSDYVSAADSLPIRHIMLKDTQVRADGTLQDEQAALFCAPAHLKGEPAWKGSCPGVDDAAGGRWFFTLNGQPYPTATVAAGGEIWRLTQASASVAYDLAFRVPSESRDMIVQVLAVDGVAVRLPKGYKGAGLASVGGAKFDPTPCPAGPDGKVDTQALCVARLLMLPSSRIELYVAYRDANGQLADPTGKAVVLRTRGRVTGPTGDSWPAIDLAEVAFKAAGSAPHAARTVLTVAGDAHALRNPVAIAHELGLENVSADSAGKDCQPLAPGHRRRIFFNIIKGAPNEGQPFGLGYEETDANGVPVPGTFVDVASFNPERPTICVQLGVDGAPVHETWELVNISGEDHNFHVHQVKFSLATRDAISGNIVPDDGVLHDNVPVRHADGTCISVAKWRRHKCLAHPVLVDIPFAIAGDYVYHCHILEHEDGGMMAVIRVRKRASPT